jgi:hypothetical protein
MCLLRSVAVEVEYSEWYAMMYPVFHLESIDIDVYQSQDCVARQFLRLTPTDSAPSQCTKHCACVCFTSAVLVSSMQYCVNDPSSRKTRILVAVELNIGSTLCTGFLLGLLE